MKIRIFDPDNPRPTRRARAGLMIGLGIGGTIGVAVTVVSSNSLYLLIGAALGAALGGGYGHFREVVAARRSNDAPEP